MSRALLTSTLDLLESRRPILLYSAVWTAVLTMVVAVAAVSPELAFLWSVSPPSSSSSSFSTQQQQQHQSSSSFSWGTLVRVPLDIPTESVRLPAEFFRKSKIDYLVPPLFAAAVVAGSACVIRAFGM